MRHPGRRLGGPRGPLCRREEQGSGTENIQVNGADDSSVVSALQAKLAADPSIDYIVTLGAPIALDALKAMDQASSKAKLVTFDLNAEAAQAIKDGKIQFSVDQQPYVQGYLAVTSLYLNKKNGNDIGGGRPVLTGPSFVDSTQHRRHPPVHQEQHPLIHPSVRRRGPARAATQGSEHEPTPHRHPRCLACGAGPHDGHRPNRRTALRPLGAHAEASNRVQLGWSNRLLARPEVGALVAAVILFIFFLIVAPAFRSVDSLMTVLYQSSTIGIVAVGRRPADDRW